MSGCLIGQKACGFVIDCGQSSSLEALGIPIGWMPVDQTPGVIPRAAEGELPGRR